jgi:glycerophosphoryl diester phosphodiesterase
MRRRHLLSLTAAPLATSLATSLANHPHPISNLKSEISDAAKPPLPPIIAHRGASYDAPENTPAAFDLAWEQDADGIEGDFYLSADKQLVCIHDATTGRTADRDLPVKESTFDELHQLDVGSWKDPKFAGQRIVLLSHILDSLPADKLFFIELKSSAEAVPALVEALADSPAPLAQLRLISFHAAAIRAAKDALPDLACSWLSSLRSKDKPLSAQAIIATLEDCGADALGAKADLAILTPDYLASLADAGFPTHVWTVNDPDQARACADLGVASITTDRPAFLRAHLAT